MRLFNRGYKVVLKFPIGDDADRVTLFLASQGIKTKRKKDTAFDHRVKCWFEDIEDFKRYINIVIKSGITAGIV